MTVISGKVKLMRIFSNSIFNPSIKITFAVTLLLIWPSVAFIIIKLFIFIIALFVTGLESFSIFTFCKSIRFHLQKITHPPRRYHPHHSNCTEDGLKVTSFKARIWNALLFLK